MKLISHKSIVNGQVRIPGSKSHTIRALIISTLANGNSVLINPLESGDTISCLNACRSLGAEINQEKDRWSVIGKGIPDIPDDIIDVGNSGTTLYLMLSIAALIPGWSVFTGDYQIRRRSAQSLITSLEDLGATCFSTQGNGCAPIVVRGKMRGGSTTIECPTSQYLSSLLLSSPLAKGDTEIFVQRPNKSVVGRSVDILAPTRSRRACL